MDFLGSRLFLYYNERKLDKDIKTDAGSTVSEGIKALKLFGLCKESTWPYLPEKFAVCPTDNCYKEALTNKVINAHQVDINALKQTLAAGFVIAFGMTLFSTFESDDVAQTGMVPIPTDKDEEIGG